MPMDEKPKTLTVGSLFAGVEGFSTGLERVAGPVRFETKWCVEIDDDCQAILRRHWPEAKLYDDVKTVGAHNLERVDVITGGFPCQDVSLAGKRAGFKGHRSSLWHEFRRILKVLRPKYV